MAYFDKKYKTKNPKKKNTKNYYEETIIESGTTYITFHGSGYYLDHNRNKINFSNMGRAKYPGYDENGNGILQCGDILKIEWTDTYESSGTERGKRHETHVKIVAVDQTTGKITKTEVLSDSWKRKNDTVQKTSSYGFGFGFFSL